MSINEKNYTKITIIMNIKVIYQNSIFFMLIIFPTDYSEKDEAISVMKEN